MKKEYYIEYRHDVGETLSWCKDIRALSEKIEEILESEDVILNSIVIYTQEKTGDPYEDVKNKIKSLKKKNSN